MSGFAKFLAIRIAVIIVFAVISLRLLTPNVLEVSFLYSNCEASTGYSETDRMVTMTVVCSQKDVDGNHAVNAEVIGYREDFIQRLSEIVPFLGRYLLVRFDFEAVNQSTAKIYSNNQERYVEILATVECIYNDHLEVIQYGERLPPLAYNATFLKPSELASYYASLTDQIRKKCHFRAPRRIPNGLHVRNATSTEPIPEDALFVGEPGSNIEVRASLVESYKIKLRPDVWSYVFFAIPFIGLYGIYRLIIFFVLIVRARSKTDRDR